MLLYHGSSVAVQSSKILESDRRLDFGTGFYLTSSLLQAERWANLTTERRKNGKATVSVFEIDENAFKSLKILYFEKAGKEWLEYVSKNHKNLPVQDDDFDLIIGSVANDKTMPVISLYFSGIYDMEVSKKINQKYGFSQMESFRKFLNSETYRMLSDPKLEMWDFSPDGIFDMWENEQITGTPQTSLYLSRD